MGAERAAAPGPRIGRPSSPVLRYVLLAAAVLCLVGSVRMWAYDSSAGAIYLLVLAAATGGEGTLAKNREIGSISPIVLAVLGVLFIVGLVWYLAVV